MGRSFSTARLPSSRVPLLGAKQPRCQARRPNLTSRTPPAEIRSWIASPFFSLNADTEPTFLYLAAPYGRCSPKALLDARRRAWPERPGAAPSAGGLQLGQDPQGAQPCPARLPGCPAPLGARLPAASSRGGRAPARSSPPPPAPAGAPSAAGSAGSGAAGGAGRDPRGPPPRARRGDPRPPGSCAPLSAWPEPAWR